MRSLGNYDQGGDMQIIRPTYAHEGPKGSWPGAVSPAEARYDELRRMEEQRNQQLGRQVERIAEVVTVLEPVLVAG